LFPENHVELMKYSMLVIAVVVVVVVAYEAVDLLMVIDYSIVHS
jgi:preprotein translocase subunit SecE